MRVMSEQPQVATLYYDGHCPLCMREMAKLSQLKSQDLQLVDIHSLAQEDATPDRDKLLRDLHLRTADGRWVTGVEANVLAWGYTARGRWLAWLRWPVIRPLADLGYSVWARWRYRRLYSGGGSNARCSRGTCSISDR